MTLQGQNLSSVFLGAVALGRRWPVCSSSLSVVPWHWPPCSHHPLVLCLAGHAHRWPLTHPEFPSARCLHIWHSCDCKTPPCYLRPMSLGTAPAFFPLQSFCLPRARLEKESVGSVLLLNPTNLWWGSGVFFLCCVTGQLMYGAGSGPSLSHPLMSNPPSLTLLPS